MNKTKGKKEEKTSFILETIRFYNEKKSYSFTVLIC